MISVVSDLSSLRDMLTSSGVRSVMGTSVNAAGLTLAKSVPLARLDVFHRAGMGASPVWHVFCIDAAIAWTDTISAVGDLRLRLDIEAVRDLGGGLAWGPTEYFSQDGEPSAACTRGLLAAVERRLAAAGLAARVGHELEFVLVGLDGSALDDPGWVPYGATDLVEREEFLADLVSAAAIAGLDLEQVHAEYGRNQFEISLPPASPVAAADSAVLAKILVGRVARKHNMRASFSPVPFAGSVGNGAHQHFSLTRDGNPVFSGGDGPHGLTAEGSAATAGVVGGLPAIQGILTGSILSGLRLAPGLWSGAHLCWGLENREAAVRFLRGGPSNPHGANLEVKAIDPSANVYSASAAILALALDGIATAAALPIEVPDDPSKWTEQQRNDAGLSLLPSDVATIVDALDSADLTRKLLGDAVVDTTVATRRHEQAVYGDETAEALADRFRLAWSI